MAKSSSHWKLNVKPPQWHLTFVIFLHGGHSPMWHHFKGQLCRHPAGRTTAHCFSQLPQPPLPPPSALLSSSSHEAAVSCGAWQRFSHACRPHGSSRAHGLPHANLPDLLHGFVTVACSPRHTTSTGKVHGGHGVPSWQGLPHTCPHPSCTAVHGCTQGGHAPKWQGCGICEGWLHFDFNLQSREHFGGRAVFSRPQGTVLVVCPHAHATVLVSGHG